jgi:hypothetical protein
MEWSSRVMNHEEVFNIMKNFNIIARSESHAKAISNFSNLPVVGIVDDWNIEQLSSVVDLYTHPLGT